MLTDFWETGLLETPLSALGRKKRKREKKDYLYMVVRLRTIQPDLFEYYITTTEKGQRVHNIIINITNIETNACPDNAEDMEEKAKASLLGLFNLAGI